MKPARYFTQRPHTATWNEKTAAQMAEYDDIRAAVLSDILVVAALETVKCEDAFQRATDARSPDDCDRWLKERDAALAKAVELMRRNAPEAKP